MLNIDPKEYSFRFSYTPEVSLGPANQPPTMSGDCTPDRTWEQSSPSPLAHSPWSSHVMTPPPESSSYSYTGLMGSLVREEGHIYSLAAARGLLYTGSDSKNIRVWKNQKEFSGFKANSGLVKAIIISGERIFTGHQDGKIRVWKVSAKDPSIHKRVGTLPTFKATIKSSFNPNNYIEVRKKRNTIWIKHIDAISSLSLCEDETLLYSASWDRTIKVWRISDSKCLESITAHDDAVNSVIAGFDGLVFTGSADGNVKVWRREFQGKVTKHFFSQTLLKLECAVTALAVSVSPTFLYCGSSDGMVNFWESDKSLSHAGVLRGHKLAVLCLATSGNLVFTGSADTTICVWRREGVNHVYITLLSGHDGPVKCLAVEDDDDREHYSLPQGADGDRPCTVYSGSLDKSVKIWRVSAQTAAGPPFHEENQNHGETIPSTQSFCQGSSKTGQRRKH